LGSAELLGGGLEVVGRRVDEPNRAADRLEELENVCVLSGKTWMIASSVPAGKPPTLLRSRMPSWSSNGV
jgi:hypothetical protein